MRFRLHNQVPFLLVFLSLSSLCSQSPAIELSAGGDPANHLSLDSALKVSSLTSYAPDDPLLYPERWNETALFRFRLGLNAQHGESVSSELAYEHRARWLSDDAGGHAAGGVLPSEAYAPYRIGQLDWQLVESDDTFFYRHELDRVLLAVHSQWGEIVIGRQAIGLGRGVFFGAVDVFSPFSPIEVDREWRRGVDAVRVEVKLTDTSSAEVLGAFGKSWEDSALLGRARGYLGNVDGELLFGKRGEDLMAGGCISAAVLDAEVHLELALFDTPEAQPDGRLFGNDNLVLKSVVGSSYAFDVGNGLTLLGEYHYSGFGVKHVGDTGIPPLSETLQQRFLRGDAQILGRHAIALQLSHPFSDIWSGSLLILQSPIDGSGLVSPSISWDIAQNVSLVASSFVPWGASPEDGKLGSEYGGTPTSLFVQMNVYF